MRNNTDTIDTQTVLINDSNFLREMTTGSFKTSLEEELSKKPYYQRNGVTPVKGRASGSIDLCKGNVMKTTEFSNKTETKLQKVA